MISFCTFFNFFVLIRGLICSFIKSIVSKVSLKTDKQEAGDVKECIGTKVVDLEKGAKILTRKDLEDLIFGSEATIFRSASTIRAEEKDENFRISSERGIPEISSQPMVRTFSSLRPWSISQLIHSESFNEINNYNSQKFILFKNPEGANENTRETGFNPRCFKVKETKAMVENLELEDKVEALRQRLMSDVSSNSASSFIAQSQSSPSVCRIPSMESVIDPMFFHLPSLPRAMTTAPMMRQIPHPFNFFLNTVPPDESVDENDEYSFGVDSYTTGVGQFEWSFEPEDSISTISSTFDFRPSTPSPLKQLYMSSFQQPQTSPHRHLFAC